MLNIFYVYLPFLFHHLRSTYSSQIFSLDWAFEFGGPCLSGMAWRFELAFCSFLLSFSYILLGSRMQSPVAFWVTVGCPYQRGSFCLSWGSWIGLFQALCWALRLPGWVELAGWASVRLGVELWCSSAGCCHCGSLFRSPAKLPDLLELAGQCSDAPWLVGVTGAFLCQAPRLVRMQGWASLGSCTGTKSPQLGRVGWGDFCQAWRSTPTLQNTFY